jgi:hypothetical protein
VGIFATAACILSLYGVVRMVRVYLKKVKLQKAMTPVQNPIHMVIRVPVSPKASPNLKPATAHSPKHMSLDDDEIL